MPTYIIRIYHLGSLINKETITAIDSLSAINYHIAANITEGAKYPTFEMRNSAGIETEYVSPAYSFEARDIRMELS